MLAMKGRFCRLIFCDTETKVELVRDVKLAHVLPQLSLTKLPSTNWIPSRFMLPVALVARIISPATVGQAPTSTSASV
jgi:hypothetical protein